MMARPFTCAALRPAASIIDSSADASSWDTCQRGTSSPTPGYTWGPQATLGHSLDHTGCTTNSLTMDIDATLQCLARVLSGAEGSRLLRNPFITKVDHFTPHVHITHQR